MRKIIFSFVWMSVLFCLPTIHAQSDSSARGMRQGGGQGERQIQRQPPPTKQGTGTVSGFILNNEDKPMDYATVSILKSADSSLVSGGITNQNGRININDVPFGDYWIRISYIGLKSIIIPNVSITKEKPNYNLGKQKFAASAQQLQGVTISAEKEMIQNNLDKRVFNVNRSIVTAGATGEDVLSNIPSVSVDLDGNVSLRGSESVTVLINNRPTTLSMNEIPAEMIESVEVVTNPSAKHDPDGVSGIINVILKKDKKLGFNASITAGTGVTNYKNKFYFGNFNAGVNLNFMYKKVNFYVSYNVRSFSYRSFSDMTRENIFNQDTTFLMQNSTGNGGGMPHNVRTGIDYFINDENSISFDFSYRRRGFGGNTDINSLTTRNDVDTISLYDQHSYMPRTASNGWNAGFNYDYNSKKTRGQNLNIDLSFSQSDRNNINEMEQAYVLPAERNLFQQSKTKAVNYRATAQIDFVTPVGNGGRLETGYKFNFNFDKDTYNYFVGADKDNLRQDTNRDNASQYTQYINAVYLIYSNSIKKKFKYQLGLRAELANVFSKLASDQDEFIPKPYFNIFPTVHLRYDFNDIHSMQFGYSMRVGRPRGHQLNPYIDDSDKLNLRQGNRKLLPEYTQSFDLQYLFMKNKSSVMAGIFYRYRYDIISRYTLLINDSTTLTSYQNLNSSHSYGVEMSYQQDIFKFWKLSLTGSLYQIFIKADSLYDQSLSNNVTGQVRLNNSFDLKYDFQLQLSADYRAPTLTTGGAGGGGGQWMLSSTGQGKMSASWGIDFGIKKSFLKKTLSISLRVSDIFGTKHRTFITSHGETQASAYYSELNRYRDSRQFWLTVSYQIVNYKTKKKIRTIDEPEEY